MAFPRIRIRAAAAAAAAVMLLAGCPYAADQPLSDPSSAVPDRVLNGTWRSQDPESHEAFTLTFATFDEHEMVGFGRESGAEDKPISAFRLFVTPIGQETFLNVQELRDDAQPQWYFARYRVSGDTLSIRLVDDALFGSKSFPTREALQAFIRANLADPRLWGRPDDTTLDMVLRRVPK
jgi:hypothetical protein